MTSVSKSEQGIIKADKWIGRQPWIEKPPSTGIVALVIKSDAWLDRKTARPEPECLVILDDVLTTGRLLRAMNFVLDRRFPQAQIIGTFITRRVVPEDPIFEHVFADQ